MLMHRLQGRQCVLQVVHSWTGDVGRPLLHVRLPDYEKDEGTPACRAHAYEDLTID